MLQCLVSVRYRSSSHSESDRPGASKGFAFVQFADESSVPAALTLDRHTEDALQNRPMLVSKCRDKAKPTGNGGAGGASEQVGFLKRVLREVWVFRIHALLYYVVNCFYTYCAF